MIDKKTAALLFAHSFKLVDKEGNEYRIRGVEQSSKGGRMMLADNKTHAWTTTELSQIGKDYFVLTRCLSTLTDNVEIEGEIFKPIERLGHIIDWNYGYERIEHWKIDLMNKWHFLPQLSDNLCKPITQ